MTFYWRFNSRIHIKDFKSGFKFTKMENYYMKHARKLKLLTNKGSLLLTFPYQAVKEQFKCLGFQDRSSL